jgi:glycosyltransferase involved in cell wall biosynthesis
MTKNNNKLNLFYFGIEPLKARYSGQLSTKWMPEAFGLQSDKINFIDIPGEFDETQEIKVGAVLDAVGRGKYAMSQCSNFLSLLNEGNVKNGDIIFLQDFWTPGIESIFYALDLYGYKDIKFYARNWAQSSDEYDFTFGMRKWMRHYELGLAERLNGMFVGSTLHRDLLRQDGYTCPIHVMSMPVSADEIRNKIPNWKSQLTEQKKPVVMFSSRLDKEKNPFFMLEVAKQFLKENPYFEWHVTTSGKSLRSMLPGVIDAFKSYAKEEPRFKILEGLTKEEYYEELASNAIIFNSSLQDWVSFTIVEGTAFGIDVVYPNFRGFPEQVPANRMYTPFDVNSAVEVLTNTKRNILMFGSTNYGIVERSDLGRRTEAWIVANNPDFELNIWHEAELCEELLKK